MLPKATKDNWEQTVKVLKEMLCLYTKTNNNIHRRYNCLQMKTKELDDYVTYARTANLIFTFGLLTHQDFKIRELFFRNCRVIGKNFSYPSRFG